MISENIMSIKDAYIVAIRRELQVATLHNEIPEDKTVKYIMSNKSTTTITTII